MSKAKVRLFVGSRAAAAGVAPFEAASLYLLACCVMLACLLLCRVHGMTAAPQLRPSPPPCLPHMGVGKMGTTECSAAGLTAAAFPVFVVFGAEGREGKILSYAG